jgi:CHAD domain-containing protein
MVAFSPEERAALASLVTLGDTPAICRRAQLLLLYEEGLPTREVAARVGLSRGRARHWRRLFQIKGMEIFPSAHTSAVGEEATISLPPLAEENQPSPPLPPLLEEAPKGEESLDFLFSLQSPGVTPTDSLAEAGRKVLRFQFAQMLRHEKGTKLGEDIEALHDMRVATRRMRAACEVFADAFKPKPLNNHLKGVRTTGRALGRVRDLDVFMDKARQYLQTLPIERQGELSPLLEAWQSERQAAREEMLAHLGSEQYQTFKAKFLDFLTTPGAGAKKRQAFPPIPQTVAQVAPILIYTRLAAARAFAPLLHTASLEQLHALRIEFKKLRYALEFFREVLGGEAKEIINEIKTLQDHLGDLNDAKVACQLLRQFLEEWDLQQANQPVDERQSPQPLLDYLSFQHAERHRLMITFQTAWQRFDCAELRQKLAAAVAML